MTRTLSPSLRDGASPEKERVHGRGGRAAFGLAGAAPRATALALALSAALAGCDLLNPTIDAITVPKPTIDPSGRTLYHSIMVGMSGPAGASIHFTLDGSTPTEKSLRYVRATEQAPSSSYADRNIPFPVLRRLQNQTVACFQNKTNKDLARSRASFMRFIMRKAIMIAVSLVSLSLIRTLPKE